MLLPNQSWKCFLFRKIVDFWKNPFTSQGGGESWSKNKKLIFLGDETKTSKKLQVKKPECKYPENTGRAAQALEKFLFPVNFHIEDGKNCLLPKKL